MIKSRKTPNVKSFKFSAAAFFSGDYMSRRTSMFTCFFFLFFFAFFLLVLKGPRQAVFPGH